jgi:hypothetical protein
MKIVTRILAIIVCALLVVSSVRIWPFLKGEYYGWLMVRKFEAAKRVAERIAVQIRPKPQFTGLQFYVWPKEGVILKFEGSVPSSNDLVELKRLVDAERGTIPVRWTVLVSTNAAE